MPRVNNVIQQVSQLNTYKQGKVFEFLKNVLTSNEITNSVDKEIAENRFNKRTRCPFCNHDKILSMENIMVKKVLSKDINIRIQIAKKLTDKPIGVNIMLLSPYADEVAKIVAEEKVSVVTTGAGNPSKYMKAWLDAGIKVIPVVASVAMARLMTRLGASALIAEGGESGGHVGELTTMVLVPQICDATHLPVLAAGGIADGRGMAAAFMLGAQGIQMGTRFLSAIECNIHPTYKEKILKANDLSTMVTGKRLGHPVRSLRTQFARDYWKAEYSTMPDDELEAMAAGALRLAVCEGDNKKGCFLAGQIASMVRKEQTAAEIIKEVMEEAEVVLRRAEQWIK